VPRPSAPIVPGVKVHDLKKNVDERGFFAEIYREDWKDLLGDDKVVQAFIHIWADK
jgi:dTDP-4-dehydrorhamnose 3,5-epimerase-like enzyme